MKYTTYLENKNLSKNTIRIYLINYYQWKKFIEDKNPTKKLFVNFIKQYQKNHKPASVHLMYSSIISIFRFEKRWKLINEVKDIKLPKSEFTLKPTISIKEFNDVKDKIVFEMWKDQRDWLMFCFMFLTGVRVSELLSINLKEIKNNKLLINGKGNKTRIIYINSYLEELINSWKFNKIAINTRKKNLSYKQINIRILNFCIKYFNKEITPHGLRRSYATNLLKNNINLEIVRKTLGHSNINSTSRYIQYTDEEILNEIKTIF